MNTTWILEKNVFSEQCFDDMVDHFKINNIPYHIVKIIPFIHEIDDGSVIINTSNVVCYGSIAMQKVAIKNNWNPGIWSSDKYFNVESYSYHYGNDFLNNDMFTCTLSEVMNNYHKINGDSFFIRPVSDEKYFPGTHMLKDDFYQWYTNMLNIGYLDDYNFPVLISSIKEIGKEWRIVVVDNQISSYSLYKDRHRNKTEHSIDVDALTFANNLIFRNPFYDVYVMDICEVVDGYKVIECNTFNFAGLYKCDVSKIIDDINFFLDKGFSV